jgi:hypothetical protein
VVATLAKDHRMTLATILILVATIIVNIASIIHSEQQIRKYQ